MLFVRVGSHYFRPDIISEPSFVNNSDNFLIQFCQFRVSVNLTHSKIVDDVCIFTVKYQPVPWWCYSVQWDNGHVKSWHCEQWVIFRQLFYLLHHFLLGFTMNISISTKKYPQFKHWGHQKFSAVTPRLLPCRHSLQVSRNVPSIRSWSSAH